MKKGNLSNFPPLPTIILSSLKSKPISSPDIDDPLRVLKIRFAKGEITKEQYEDMRKMLEL